MTDDRKNYLDVPETPTFEEQLNYALAVLVTTDERAFPVYDNAEKSTHPIWKNNDEWHRYLIDLRNGEDMSGYAITKVFSVTSVGWSEFLDTYVGNSDHEGLLAEVERADGWTGRYCLEITLGEAIRDLQAGWR